MQIPAMNAARRLRDEWDHLGAAEVQGLARLAFPNELHPDRLSGRALRLCEDKMQEHMAAKSFGQAGPD